MSLRTIYLAVVVFLSGFVAACTQNSTTPPGAASGPSPSPVANAGPGNSTRFVKASGASVQITPGKSAEATVTLTIQSGYHVNANPPTYPYLRATELSVQTSDGLSVSFLTYPNPVTRKFSFEKKPLSVYEGEVPIKVTLKALPAAKVGDQSLPARLNVQACDDQVCYPPGTLDISIPVAIR